ncbi:hypothetical protein IE077_004161, partial [Cardiosporidium cionae]
ATHSDAYFPQLVQSAALLRIPLHVLGWNCKWKGFRTKLEYFKEFCNEVPPKDVVVCLDGFDTLFLQPAHVILQKFLDFNVPMVITAENPSSSLFPYFFECCHDLLFLRNDKIRWPLPKRAPLNGPILKRLNAGCFIGYAQFIKNCLDSLPDTCQNDQFFLTDFYLKNANQCVILDATCELFLLVRTNDKIEFISPEEEKMISNGGSEGSSFQYYDGKPRSSQLPLFHNKSNNNNSISVASPISSPLSRVPYPFLKIIKDKDFNTYPCILHIHCRRNANWLLKKMGLLKTWPLLNFFLSYPWYIIYSLGGTRHSTLYMILLLSVVSLSLATPLALIHLLFRWTNVSTYLVDTLELNVFENVPHLTWPAVPLAVCSSTCAAAIILRYTFMQSFTDS